MNSVKILHAVVRSAITAIAELLVTDTCWSTGKILTG